MLIEKKPQAPILTRLNRSCGLLLVRESVVKRDKPLNFRDIIDQKKIFLARLPQGAIGEENYPAPTEKPAPTNTAASPDRNRCPL